MNEHKEHFNSKQYICYDGLNTLEVNTEGDVLPCCPDWHNYYKFGNIFEQSFIEIINSESAKMFRKSILNGDYKFCNHKICMSTSVKRQNLVNYCDESGTLIHPVNVVRFAHDRTCNLKCITCRNDYIDTTDKVKKLNELIDSHFLPMLSGGVKIVHLNTNGELFASSHCKKLISAIIKEYPDIRFDITSNGVLFNEENCINLNLLNRINNVGISIHAATNSTYNKITGSKGKDNYQKVCNNIKYLIKLKNQKKINDLSIIFVVNYFNYKEMIRFAKKRIFRKNNIKIYFWEYRPWTSSDLSKEYNKMAVWEPKNKCYKSFCKIINNKIFQNENILLPKIFMELRNQKESRNIFYGLIELLKKRKI